MPDSSDLIAAKFGLTNAQTMLYMSLWKRDEGIAQIYLGAVTAIQANGDPERLPKIAYEMRELMVGISSIVDADVQINKESLTTKVNELEKVFEAALTNSKCRPPDWIGSVDPPLQELLYAVQKFMTWKGEHCSAPR